MTSLPRHRNVRSTGSFVRFREERGAIAIMGAILTGLIVTMAALGVDVGNAAFEKRDVQKVADLAALDAQHAITGPQAQLRPAGMTISEYALKLARESATRNGFDWQNAPLDEQIGIVLGIGDRVARTFTPLAPGADESTANAVQVLGDIDYDYRFVPGRLGLGVDAVSVGLKSGPPPICCPDPCQVPPCATTQQEGSGHIMVGSRVLRASTAGAPMLNNTLTGLGMGPATLDVASYEGLAAADVTMEKLWIELGLGSPDEILNSHVTYGELIDATIDALNSEGSGVNTVAVAALTALKASAGGSFDPTLTFTFADMIGLGLSSPGSAGYANVKVLDLLFASAEVANDDQLVSVAVPLGQVPGVESGTIKIGMIEPPQFAAGLAKQNADGTWVTHADTAQARVLIQLRLTTSVVLGLITGPIDVSIYLDGGRAEADLTGIDCGLSTPASLTTVPAVVHAKTSALNAYVGTVTDAALTNPNVDPTVDKAVLSTLSTGGKIYGESAATAPGTDQSINFTGAFDTRVATVGSSGVGLNLTANLDVTADAAVSPLEAPLLITEVKAQVSTVLGLIDASLLGPLGDSLGLRFAGADYANPAVDCFDPILIQ